MIELLYVDGCPSAAEAEALVRRILVEEGRTAPLLKIAVETPEQAGATRFLGSPTVRGFVATCAGSSRAPVRQAHGYRHAQPRGQMLSPVT